MSRQSNILAQGAKEFTFFLMLLSFSHRQISFNQPNLAIRNLRLLWKVKARIPAFPELVPANTPPPKKIGDLLIPWSFFVH